VLEEIADARSDIAVCFVYAVCRAMFAAVRTNLATNYYDLVIAVIKGDALR